MLHARTRVGGVECVEACEARRPARHAYGARVNDVSR